MQKMSIRSLLFFIKLKCWKIFSVVYIFARQWKKKKKVEISPSSLPINLFTPYYVNEPHFHTASACLKLPDKVAHSILCLTLSSITSHWTINQLVLPLLSPSLPFSSRNRSDMQRSNLSILFFFLLLSNFSLSEDPSPTCPYPCLPPPTWATNYPPPPPAWSGYPPPQPVDGVIYTPPYMPYSPPSNALLGAPPPPEPILPYFPFYYRRTPPLLSAAPAVIRAGAIFVPLLVLSTVISLLA